MKKFESIDNQLIILHKRGLLINNYPRAKQYLLTNNYYNFINGYSKFFMNPSNTLYINNATFDEITHLYFFDQEIKFAFFRAVTESENHIKSVLAYRFSEYIPDKPYAYLDINSYDNSKVLELGWLISQLSRIINKQKRDKNTNSIKHYVKKHNDVPIWVLIDYLDFGEMHTLLRSLPTSLQNSIAKNMCSFVSCHMKITSPFTPEIMNSFLGNMREVRNVCAHNNRLLGFKCRSDIKYYKDLHLRYNLSSGTHRSDIYNVFISMQCFLSKIQYAKLHNTILKRIKTLDKHLISISTNDILQSLGFPADWHKNTQTLTQ